MKQYLDTIRHVLEHGVRKQNRTGTDTIGVFGHQARFDLQDGFPLLTTKKVHFPAIVHELLWFIKGDTNIKYLVDNNVRIWNEWPYERFRKSAAFNGETMPEFVERIRTDASFAKEHGELGPVYGKQWRDCNGVDQLANAIDLIQNNPNSRRIIVSAWNPAQIKDMALPPCHCLFHFQVEDGKLNCLLYQRSCDLFLGVPFNIASYALLTLMVSHVTGLKPGTFVHTYGDLHIYENHLEQVKLQLTREPRPLPHVKLNPAVQDLFAFTYDDIELLDYDPHPPIKGIVAV